MGLFRNKKDVYGIPGYYEYERPTGDSSKIGPADGSDFVFGGVIEERPDKEKEEPQSAFEPIEEPGETAKELPAFESVDEKSTAETAGETDYNEEVNEMNDSKNYPETNKGNLRLAYRYWPADPQNVTGDNKWQFAEDEASAKQAGANYEPVWVWDRGNGARITFKDMLTPDEIRLYAP